MHSVDAQEDQSSVRSSHPDIVVCPACGGALHSAPSGFVCSACHNAYPQEQGIPLLFWPHEGGGSQATVAETVKAFYEDAPFPNYEEFDSIWSLREKAQEGLFARLLDAQIPDGARVLEAGCGTGQLSNFLGSTFARTVFGADLCLNSLNLAHGFKKRNRIDNVTFLQMNLFRPVFKPESFDLVISNGVLLVTSDPFAGFQSIARLVKKGGYILIGLYNTYGRLLTDLRRVIFNLSGDRFLFLDPRLRDKTIGAARKRAWFMDQYKHPHETKQTIGEVLGWFDRTGFEFINSIPKAQAFRPFLPNEPLFVPNPRGSALDHFLVQSEMLLRGSEEGGFFTMIGRKRA